MIIIIDGEDVASKWAMKMLLLQLPYLICCYTTDMTRQLDSRDGYVYPPFAQVG